MAERSRQDSFNNWYAKNAADFNAKRRARYHADPTVRFNARVRAAQYRQRGAELPDQRDGFNTSARVASQLNISPQTLRNWEARYLIPKARYGNRHRLYTDFQVELLRDMVAHPIHSEEFKEARRAVFRLWEETQ